MWRFGFEPKQSQLRRGLEDFKIYRATHPGEFIRARKLLGGKAGLFLLYFYFNDSNINFHCRVYITRKGHAIRTCALCTRNACLSLREMGYCVKCVLWSCRWIYDLKLLLELLSLKFVFFKWNFVVINRFFGESMTFHSVGLFARHHNKVVVFGPRIFPNLINMSGNAIIRTVWNIRFTRIDGGNSERFQANNT